MCIIVEARMCVSNAKTTMVATVRVPDDGVSIVSVGSFQGVSSFGIKRTEG